MNYQKIIQAVKVARMVKQSKDVVFQVINQGGFYMGVDGKILLEFNTLQEASDYTTSFNGATSGLINTYISAYEQKIDDILNA